MIDVPKRPDPSTDAEVIRFASGIAVARARRGLLTVPEIQAALDEAYRMGRNFVATVVECEVARGASPHHIARRARAAAEEGS